MHKVSNDEEKYLFDIQGFLITTSTSLFLPRCHKAKRKLYKVFGAAQPCQTKTVWLAGYISLEFTYPEPKEDGSVNEISALKK